MHPFTHEQCESTQTVLAFKFAATLLGRDPTPSEFAQHGRYIDLRQTRFKPFEEDGRSYGLCFVWDNDHLLIWDFFRKSDGVKLVSFEAHMSECPKDFQEYVSQLFASLPLRPSAAK